MGVEAYGILGDRVDSDVEWFRCRLGRVLSGVRGMVGVDSGLWVTLGVVEGLRDALVDVGLGGILYGGGDDIR